MGSSKSRIQSIQAKVIDAATITVSGVPVLTSIPGEDVGTKMAAGVAAVTGTLGVVTGLAAITSVVVSIGIDAALAGLVATTTVSAGTVTVKVWKPTATGDVTPIASTTATNVNWIAVGT